MQLHSNGTSSTGESYSIKHTVEINKKLRYVNLAAALTSIQDWEGAIQAHRDALNINGNLFGVRSDLGNIFKSLGRLDEAEVCNHFLTRTGPVL